MVVKGDQLMAVALRHVTQEWHLDRVASFLLREFKHMLPPTIFFFVGFGTILLTRRLILAQYLIEVTGFTLAAGGALIVGKSVLVADELPFLNRFDAAPLAQPILFKTVVYTIVVFFARLIEEFISYLIGGGATSSFLHHLAENFSWQRFIATQIWIFILFLIYSTAVELSELLGDGELFKIMFVRRSSALKATRRQRIRALVRLSNLTAAHAPSELCDTGTPANAELVSILQRLSGDRAG
jgi:hypothetical protein